MEEPSYSKGAKKYEGPCQYDPGKEPSTICPHLPGSREKVFFLQSRVEAGERLWHENDNPGWDDTHDVPWFVDSDMLEELMEEDND